MLNAEFQHCEKCEVYIKKNESALNAHLLSKKHNGLLKVNYKHISGKFEGSTSNYEREIKQHFKYCYTPCNRFYNDEFYKFIRNNPGYTLKPDEFIVINSFTDKRCNRKPRNLNEI